MQVGIPSETTPGERRVALVPDVASRITATGATVAIQAGAGAGATARRRRLRGQRRHVDRRRRDPLRLLGNGLQSSAPDRRGGPAAERGRRHLELPPARGGPRACPCLGHTANCRLQPGPSASDQPFAGDGRALLPGARIRLPRGPAGSRAPAEVLPPLHDGGRDRAAGQGPRARRRRRRAAGDCDGAPARRRRPPRTTSGRPQETR